MGHGLLRTAHSVRALPSEGDAPSVLLDEAASGLALWAATFKPLPGHPGLHGTLDLPIAIAKLPRPNPPWSMFEAGGFARLDELPTFPGAVEALGPPDSIDAALSDLTAAFCRTLVLHPDVFPLALVHTITPAAAMRTLLPHVPEITVHAAYAQLWHTSAAIITGFTTHATPIAPSSLPSMPVPHPDEIVARAVEHCDSHALKFADACVQEHRLRPDPAYLVAATHVLEQLPAWSDGASRAMRRPAIRADRAVLPTPARDPARWTTSSRYRGCAALGSPAAQALDRAAFAEIGWTWLDHQRRAVDIGPGRVRLEARPPSGEVLVWEADVDAGRALPVPECRARCCPQDRDRGRSCAGRGERAHLARAVAAQRCGRACPAAQAGDGGWDDTCAARRSPSCHGWARGRDGWLRRPPELPSTAQAVPPLPCRSSQRWALHGCEARRARVRLRAGLNIRASRARRPASEQSLPDPTTTLRPRPRRLPGRAPTPPLDTKRLRSRAPPRYLDRPDRRGP